MPARPFVLLLVLLAAGCGRSERVEEPRIVGDALTIYSSLPRSGPLEPVARDIVRAEKLALEEAGGRAGEYRISYVSLDSADPKTGRWSPDRVAENARTAVEDLQTIAYLGELEAGASTISLPILNAGGMLQVSPGDTFAGLTAPAAQGEPDRYYPSGRRTFARMVADDADQARALAALVDRGVRRVVVADDRRVGGTALADALARELRERRGGVAVERQRLDVDRELPEDLGRRVREARADAFVYTGGHGRFAVDLLRTVAAVPRVQLVAGNGIAAARGLPEGLVLTAAMPEDDAANRDFARRFRARFGAAPDPRAVLGHEAMALVLAAIDRAGADADSRPAVIREALAAGVQNPARFATFHVSSGRLVRGAPAV